MRVIRLLEAVETTDCPIGIGQQGGGPRYRHYPRSAAAAAEAEQILPRDRAPQSRWFHGFLDLGISEARKKRPLPDSLAGYAKTKHQKSLTSAKKGCRATEEEAANISRRGSWSPPAGHRVG